MADDKRKKKVPPPAKPQELVEPSWDDDLGGASPISGLESFADNPHERVTAVPNESREEYAKRVMQEIGPISDSRKKSEGKPPTGASSDESTRPAKEEGGSPQLTPDTPDAAPEIELSIDEPGRLTYDDLSLELGPSVPLDPVLLGISDDPDKPESRRDAAPESVSSEGMERLRDLYAVGDFSGALEQAEQLLESAPGNDKAARYARSCRDVLTQMYGTRLGPLDQVVSVAIPPDQVKWLSLDHQAGFLLSLVDGSSSAEELVDASGLPRLDALRILCTLLEQRVISLSGR